MRGLELRPLTHCLLRVPGKYISRAILSTSFELQRAKHGKDSLFLKQLNLALLLFVVIICCISLDFVPVVYPGTFFTLVIMVHFRIVTLEFEFIYHLMLPATRYEIKTSNIKTKRVAFIESCSLLSFLVQSFLSFYHATL